MNFAKGSAPANLKNMIGQTFERLTVIVRAGSRGAKALWLCRCECGNDCVVSGSSLRQGQQSCGCARNGNPRHGMTGTPIHRTWAGMLNRCTNPRTPAFANYGGRGITVCDRWKTFENFLADMGERPRGHPIERVDNDRGYEPDNCKWLPIEKQAQNRRGNRLVEIAGETLCAAEAARRIGIKPKTLRYRLTKAVAKRDIGAPVGRDIFLTRDGITLNMHAWSVRLGIPRSTLSVRHKKGWSVERVLGASK